MDLRALLAAVIIVLLSWFLATQDVCASEQVDVEQWANVSEYAVYTAIVADGLQTRQIRDHDNIYEKNAFICGKNPEDNCLIAWFGARLYGVWWLNHKSGWNYIQRYRANVFMATWTFKVVHDNAELGLKVKF